MKLIDVDDDDGPAGEGVALDGDDTGMVTERRDAQLFVPTSRNATRPSAQRHTDPVNPAMTGTAARHQLSPVSMAPGCCRLTAPR